MDRLDYAPHYLEAKKKLSDTYNMLNKQEYKPAADNLDEIIAELRLMRAAVRTYMEKLHD